MCLQSISSLVPYYYVPIKENPVGAFQTYDIGQSNHTMVCDNSNYFQLHSDIINGKKYKSLGWDTDSEKLMAGWGS